MSRLSGLITTKSCLMYIVVAAVVVAILGIGAAVLSSNNESAAQSLTANFDASEVSLLRYTENSAEGLTTAEYETSDAELIEAAYEGLASVTALESSKTLEGLETTCYEFVLESGTTYKFCFGGGRAAAQSVDGESWTYYAASNTKSLEAAGESIAEQG